MKKLSLFLVNVSILAAMPVIAGAAGTYYNGNMYQSPQNRYSSANNGYYNSYGAGRGYGQQNNPVVRTTTAKVKQTQAQKVSQNTRKQGFELGVGLAHEDANWNFELNKAGSKLHYDDLSWNIIKADGAFYFGNEVPMQIKAGVSYGKQYGKSQMIDDDISNGGMWEDYIDSDGNYRGISGAPAISAGTSEDGTQFGFNASLGLTNLFSAGKVRFTPSVGYRYLKYKLTTKDNAGLMVDVLYTDFAPNCQQSGGEIQCAPYIGVLTYDTDAQLWKVVSVASLTNVQAGENEYELLAITPNGTPTYLDSGNTYYYEQPGTSHKYETEWSGPYVALDMVYDINENNSVSGGLELGLPMYESTGDQPYRVDWQHPTSVKDEGGFGDAYHLGFNGMWSTMLSDAVALSLGFTYDYYKVSKADAKTYLDANYQTLLYNIGYITEEEYNEYKAKNWVIESKDEVKSVYKSMGIRAGLNIKF